MSDQISRIAAELALAEPRTTMRDSVWSSIPLREPELRLIDTAPFQRLRRVQQLGFTAWVFPGANHTRFEHSLGVFHLARQVLLRLLRRPEGAALGEADAGALLAAALLHDVGHYPFSHAVEELEVGAIRHHETIGRELIVSSPIADVLERDWGLDPQRVADLLRSEPLGGVDGLLQDVLSGALDVDKLDYLVRDARHCNVPYGEVDVHRIVDELRIHADGAGGYRLALSEKGIGPFQSLVFARYMMFFNVYWHHTCRICTVMLLRAVQEALLAGALTPTELERVDDSTLLALLQSRTAPGSAAADLAARLRSRTLYKRALEYVADDAGNGGSPYALLARLKRDATRRRALERAWCEHLSTPARQLAGHEILVDIPDQKAFRLNMPILRRTAEGVRLGRWDRRDGLDDAIVAQLQIRMRRVRIVAADDRLRQEVRAREGELLAIAREIAGPDLTPQSPSPRASGEPSREARGQ